MPDKKQSNPKKPKVPKPGVFVSLMTDFGFKRIFGVKELMLNFLNTVLDIEGGIVEIHYTNPEKLGLTKDERKAIIDLICTTGNNEQIIVEMQAIPQEYFKDRVLFYASRIIQEQSIQGENWDYKLPPVYSINILNFNLNKKEKTKKYVSVVQLIEKETHKVFYDKLTFVFIELKRFKKTISELDNLYERWIYIIKYLQKLQNEPVEIQDKIFKLLFKTAKIANMTKNEVTNYLKDLINMNIVKNELELKDRKIAEMGAVITQKDYALSQKDRIIAQYEQKYGTLNVK